MLNGGQRKGENEFTLVWWDSTERGGKSESVMRAG